MIKKTKRSAKLYARLNPITKEVITSYNKGLLNDLVDSLKRTKAYNK